MKSAKIIRANFTPAGNAYLVDKNRDSYFCHKTVIDANKWTEAKDIKFPVYVNVKEFSYPTRDENLNPVKGEDGKVIMFSRTDVVDVFDSAQALAEDYADDFALELLKTQALKKSAITAGLTEKQVEALQSSAAFATL